MLYQCYNSPGINLRSIGILPTMNPLMAIYRLWLKVHAALNIWTVSMNTLCCRALTAGWPLFLPLECCNCVGSIQTKHYSIVIIVCWLLGLTVYCTVQVTAASVGSEWWGRRMAARPWTRFTTSTALHATTVASCYRANLSTHLMASPTVKPAIW